MKDLQTVDISITREADYWFMICKAIDRLLFNGLDSECSMSKKEIYDLKCLLDIKVEINSQIRDLIVEDGNE